MGRGWVWVEKPSLWVVLQLDPPIPTLWEQAMVRRQDDLWCLGTRRDGGPCRRVVHRWQLWLRSPPGFSGYCAAHQPTHAAVCWQLWGATDTIPCPCGCGAQAMVWARALTGQDPAVDAIYHQIGQSLGPRQWHPHPSTWSVTVGEAVQWTSGLSEDGDLHPATL